MFAHRQALGQEQEARAQRRIPRHALHRQYAQAQRPKRLRVLPWLLPESKDWQHSHAWQRHQAASVVMLQAHLVDLR